MQLPTLFEQHSTSVYTDMTNKHLLISSLTCLLVGLGQIICVEERNASGYML